MVNARLNRPAVVGHGYRPKRIPRGRSLDRADNNPLKSRIVVPESLRRANKHRYQRNHSRCGSVGAGRFAESSAIRARNFQSRPGIGLVRPCSAGVRRRWRQWHNRQPTSRRTQWRSDDPTAEPAPDGLAAPPIAKSRRPTPTKFPATIMPTTQNPPDARKQ